MTSCDPILTYILFALSPQALLAYVAEGLLAPIIVFLWRRSTVCSTCRLVRSRHDLKRPHEWTPVKGSRRIHAFFSMLDANLSS